MSKFYLKFERIYENWCRHGYELQDNTQKHGNNPF